MAKESKSSQAEVQKWLGTIRAYDKEFEAWGRRVEKILKRYKDERRQMQGGEGGSRFNVLWSNVQTLVPATFARVPQPDVSRRFSDRDPVGRVASLILERSLDYEIQHYPDYRATLRADVFDRFLGGRGTAWARYEPHARSASLQQPIDGTQVSEDETSPAAEEVLDYECAPVDYVHWKDFGHSVARTWEEVTAVWRLVYMSRAACVERFGEKKGEKIPLDANPEDLKQAARESPEAGETRRAAVYEIWDKSKKEALWLSKSMKEILDRKDDPLKLEGFFPCPRPLYATLTNDSLIPTPDFTLYQDQADELDLLSERINGLVKALKVVGCYDGAMPTEIARVFTEAVNTDLIPVKNWQAFAEKQGLKGAIDIVDLAPIASALGAAYEAMEQIKGQVHEITGISDIVRGVTQASETATAQQIKGQYVGLRLRDMQRGVAEFATELLRLKAQIIAGFDAETLTAIAAVGQLEPADQALVPQALEMLADRPLRNFRIEIAADSLVQLDEQEEKESRVEFLGAVSGYLKQTAEAAMAAPQLVPLMVELLKFGVTAFKVGRTVEGVIDQALEEYKKALAAPKPPPPPDPKVIQAQIEAQVAPIHAQAEQVRAQADMVGAQADIITSTNRVREAQVKAATPIPFPGGRAR